LELVEEENREKSAPIAPPVMKEKWRKRTA